MHTSIVAPNTSSTILGDCCAGVCIDAVGHTRSHNRFSCCLGHTSTTGVTRFNVRRSDSPVHPLPPLPAHGMPRASKTDHIADLSPAERGPPAAVQDCSHRRPSPAGRGPPAAARFHVTRPRLLWRWQSPRPHGAGSGMRAGLLVRTQPPAVHKADCRRRRHHHRRRHRLRHRRHPEADCVRRTSLTATWTHTQGKAPWRQWAPRRPPTGGRG